MVRVATQLFPMGAKSLAGVHSATDIELIVNQITYLVDYGGFHGVSDIKVEVRNIHAVCGFGNYKRKGPPKWPFFAAKCLILLRRTGCAKYAKRIRRSE